jgi:hypothetical protein
MSKRFLFILKRREDFTADPSYSEGGMSTGLLNSAQFVHDMLIDNGIDSAIEVVVDNNDIDRVVTAHNPTHVIIEALWVVPSKFNELCRLHPDVIWIVRTHSQTSFIANEGIAMEWLIEYAKYPNVFIGINSPEFVRDVTVILFSTGVPNPKSKVIYLPNYYPAVVRKTANHPHINELHIGCFGAIRPFKNHLAQAIAAIELADLARIPLFFHVNGNRNEQKGDANFKNLVALFDVNPNHTLVAHDWMPHDRFVELLSTMDLGMQVSFTETFNIVAADMIMAGVPVVASPEIAWMRTGLCSPTDILSMVQALYRTWLRRNDNVKSNSKGLVDYVHEAEVIWMNYINPPVVTKPRNFWQYLRQLFVD